MSTLLTSRPIQGKATLADVAALAGVSLSTVSRAIHKRKLHERLSRETVARVEEAARKLNYHAHHVAQTLATNRSMVIGVYVHASPSFIEAKHPAVGIGYAGDVMACAEAFFRERGYDLLLINLSNSTRQSLERCVSKFHSRQVDGILTIGGNEPGELAYLHGQSIPVVAVDYAGAFVPISHVSLDNEQAIHLAVDHLVGLGHRRVAFLGACHEDSFLDCHVRHRAFLQRMAHHGLSVTHDLNWPNTVVIERKPDYQFLEGRWVAEYLLGRGERERPTAIVTISDAQAYAAIQRLGEHGISCPDDISVVGFDDSIWARWSAPALTSVAHKVPEMTARACEILLQHIEQWYAGGQWEAVQEKIPSSLAVRESTGTAG
jgi:LacI family transcriptional regulator